MRSVLYKKLVRPLLFRFGPETAHAIAMFWLQRLPASLIELMAGGAPVQNEVTLFGLRFPNRVGLAAGFDKDAEALLAWEALGFGFVEAGTITAKAQPGNPKPRLFRYPDLKALVNRMGFNNQGADAVASRLAEIKGAGLWPRIPVGINIGKSKVTPLEEATGDYLHSFQTLHPFADYFVLNVSSPNTPGLRQLQNKKALEELLTAVQNQNRFNKPVLVKIAPDLEFGQIEEILALIETHRLAGIVATNTTLDHSCVPEARRQQGGLSGEPLRARSTEIVRFISKLSALPIIAAGGIDSPQAAAEKFDAGASLVQLYTGFIYEGPMLVRQIASLRR